MKDAGGAFSEEHMMLCPCWAQWAEEMDKRSLWVKVEMPHKELCVDIWKVKGNSLSTFWDPFLLQIPIQEFLVKAIKFGNICYAAKTNWYMQIGKWDQS